MFFLKYNLPMGKAVLIYGGTFKDRVETLRKEGVLHIENSGDPDLLIVEKEEDKKSIGIASSRKVKKFLQEKPLNKEKKTVVIANSELMTTEAQNALLKILEEPPKYAELFLLSKTENSLLETVISRCVKKRAFPSEEIEREDSGIKKILNMNPGQRLDKAKEISETEKEETVEIMEKWVRELHATSPGTVTAVRIKKILQTKKTLEETNVNQRLAVEALLLNL
ncbi:MAG: polymerase III, delta prime subunit protein [candidate division WWE3 bacterium GW2011_GWF2_41_45]|uniref:Polymerase III, delta prime subunit protein n=3 Tax=Katanobacteria TaxID=422282 RepID=A0A0G0Y1N4_UNCKA|nr:MAG: polymerase III, delta prime subunit protein [candidate division WWE3 bacterium GW2011_GWC2_41_23]KKS10520.1 MAG: polymerase III, delta prime subunit protein [candidate division WWE3 bacterium GW2011_GWF2_41_45]KKS20285.1 MAG: polymerase III, delta prime subunit protein [candidate division WWE3 bacterium GW2011_GWE1_41_72]KKS51041.1 MAG: polymerase III, delta prime subunit protein [candidate division WWE3 bacterium GW2011_GWE2_42_25]KKS63874.1 MAG: polymerase III, delta prime subunit pro